MAVTPNALFEAARVIGQGESEVDSRNAASRAYYAAYHRCRSLNESLPSPAPPVRGAVHRTIIEALTGARSSRLKSLGYMLEQCRRLRVNADYDIESEFRHQDARNALTLCEKILDKADSVPSASAGDP
jgi:uncharacterized protein (UPF0332 family)